MNQAIMIGQVVDEPKVFSGKGQYIVNFTLAIDEGTWDGTPHTAYVDFVHYRKSDKLYYGPGDKLCIEGQLTTSSFEDKKGNKQYKTKVKVNKLTKIDK